VEKPRFRALAARWIGLISAMLDGMNATSSLAAAHWQKFSEAAAPDVLAWEQSLADPQAAQARILETLLHANRDTAFGRQYDFAGIRDAEQYRARVPVQDYAAFEPWIARVQAGEAAVLTQAPVLFCERSSGNSGPAKQIPYTSAFLADMQRALVVWLADMARRVPQVASGRVYWPSSPMQHATGAGADLAFLQGSAAFALAPAVLPAPAAGGAPDWRQQTLLALCAAEDLSLMNVWSPTFLSVLLRPLFDPSDPQRGPILAALQAQLPASRREALRRSLDRGDCAALWPQLGAVSCWMDGPSQLFAEALRTRFPHVPFLPKGMCATEGVVSVPFGGHAFDGLSHGATLAIQSHFLEFVGEDGRVENAADLRRGYDYRVVLSTSGGLYRYALGDRVRAVGMQGRTPRVAFVGRTGAISDMVGEKLDEALVADALSAVLTVSASACVMPCLVGAKPHYVLLVADTDTMSGDTLHATAARLDGALAQAAHYARARGLGHLGPLQVRRLGGGAAHLASLLQQAAENAGVRAGGAKPRALVGHPDIAQALLALTEA
jgi:hypothetical protein